MHNLTNCEFKPVKNSDLNGIRAHDRFDTGAVISLAELSSQLVANTL